MATAAAEATRSGSVLGEGSSVELYMREHARACLFDSFIILAILLSERHLTNAF